MEEILGFVNSQLLSLHNFMHRDLSEAISVYAKRAGLKQVPMGGNERMRCIGTKRFREQNGIEA